MFKKYKYIFLALLTTLFLTCNRATNPHIEMETALGNILIELYPEQAPLCCENFMQYLDQGLFKGAHFYRVVRTENQSNDIKIEVVQWGLSLDDHEYLIPPVAHESTGKTGILHTDGVISMARNEPGTASSEFFICIGDQPELDEGGKRNPDGQGFAAFGKVIKGMDVVKQIHQLPDSNQFLTEKIQITSIKKIQTGE